MPHEHPQRISALQQQLRAADLDLALYSVSPVFQYLTGVQGSWRVPSRGDQNRAILIVPASGPARLLLDVHSAEFARDTWIDDITIITNAAELVAILAGYKPGGTKTAPALALDTAARERLGPELQAAFGDLPAVDAGPLTDQMRMIKSPDEIAALRKAAAMTDAVMAAVVPLITEGVTPAELEREIEYQGRQRGAAGVSFQPGAIFTRSGAEPAASPFTWPRDKGLVPGTAVAFDFGFVVDGYCSDFGRSFYYGPAGDEPVQAYAALQQSLRELTGRMHQGSMSTADLFPALEQVLDRLGFGDYLRARLSTGNLGHMIGIEVHEYPWLTPECNEPLRAGMVMALEPKLWHAGQYYLRVEDMVLVGPDSTEFLTAFDRELFQL